MSGAAEKKGTGRGPRWVSLRSHLAALHRAAIEAADPEAAVLRLLRLDGENLLVGSERLTLGAGSRLWMIAAGKASPAMARGALARIGARLTAGIVSHPHGADLAGPWPPCVSLHAAAHPLPDEGSLGAGAAALDLVRDAREGDLLIVLLSGGGSALIESLHGGLGLDDLRGLTRDLQRAGADIVELNTVRRAISRTKGGGLARAARPARVVTLALSDVVGDRPEAIASGPTVPSPTGPDDALRILESRGLLAAYPRVDRSLRSARRQPPDPSAGRSDVYIIVGSNRIAAEAVRAASEAAGFATRILTLSLEGEAREAGAHAAAAARAVRERNDPLPPPACLILGGETTVTVRGEGRGGRNLEVALGAAIGLTGCPRSAVFSFATDGVDGISRAAGAVATGETLERARAIGISPESALERNDTEPLFDALGDLWVSGPTGTNVNDLVVILVYR